MHKQTFLIFFIILLLRPLLVFSQNKVTISGYVTDLENGEKLIGALVLDSLTNKYCITNNYGFYSLQLSGSKSTIKVTSFGYTPIIISLNCKNDSIINFATSIKSFEIEEVSITNDMNSKVISPSVAGLKNLPLKFAQQLPVIMGERDILKSLQIMPEVQSGSEGNTGMYVRGGESDNNLILLDGLEVFNPNHLFGFFSLFNDDAINSVKIYTYGFPAQFGGRLSSVIDIRTKDGNSKKIKVNGTVGLISSKLQIEGPIVKDKLTFMVSARRTYLDVISKPITKNFTDYKDANYYFYDVNARFRWKISNRHSVFISTYAGKDFGYFNSERPSGKTPPDSASLYNFSANIQDVKWGNKINSARYEWMISEKMFVNVSLGNSSYNFSGIDKKSDISSYWLNDSLVEKKSTFQLNTESRIKLNSFKIELNNFLGQNHQLTYGLSLNSYSISPNINNASYLNSVSDLTKMFELKYGYLFLQDEFKLNENKLIITPGINASRYPDLKSSKIKVEKRLTVQYNPYKKFKFSFGYSEMSQHVHLLKLARINLASDLWLPSYNKIKPSECNNFTLGTSLLILNGLTAGIEVYKSDYKNLLAYKEGVQFNTQLTDFSDIVTSGIGNSRGFEVYIEKSSGSLVGIASYAYSISERRFKELNFGKSFKSEFDRPHNFKIAVSKTINNKWQVSSLFNLMSGSLQTLANVKYNSLIGLGGNPWSMSDRPKGGTDILIYAKNNYRLPLYHRLDISATYTYSGKKSKNQLSFGLYNAYNSKNAYEMQANIVIDVKQSDTSYVKLNKKVLFPIFPFVSYRIEY